MNKIIISFFLMITIFNVFNFQTVSATSYTSTMEMLKGVVIEAYNIEYHELANVKDQKVLVKITSDSKYKDEEVEATFVIQALDSAESKGLEEGATVFVQADTSNPDEIVFYITDVDRIPYLIFVVILFIGVIILVGRKQGLKTVVSLAVTLLSIFYVLIPMVLAGQNAVFSAVVVSVIIAIVSFILITGFSKKGFVATVSTILGVVIGAGIAFILSELARITGLSDSESQMLIYLTRDMVFDINGIFFAGIIIGTIGATMDIGMSISSAMEEISINAPNMTTKELIASGMNVGRDAMGTMANTLILAYVGSSINIVLLYVLSNNDFTMIMNSDFMASEILRSFCSTIGMILTIPITAYMYGYVCSKRNEDSLEIKINKIKNR